MLVGMSGLRTYYAPVALFAYARLQHLQQTVQSLQANPEAKKTVLYVFCDGEKNDVTKHLVAEVRAYVESIEGFYQVIVKCRGSNFGLARSLVTGVSEVLSTYESIIVLEDDLVVSRHFLSYMNDALRRFKYDDRVVSIHGYVYPTKGSLPEAFFLRGADCWGWATWRRGWAFFDDDSAGLLARLEQQELIDEFDFSSTYPFSKMLREHIAGHNDSWAIRWYASAFLANKLTLYPGRSLVSNIGNDGSGSHCGDGDIYDAELSATPIDLSRVEVMPSVDGRMAFENFFRRERRSRRRAVARRFMRAFLGRWV